ncbi:MAG: complement resistance protein TraT [Desulfovibrio sp.]|jgi:hypothetical protein|nr:complement resistance protein TraT [Desulfovibrio sp.]
MSVTRSFLFWCLIASVLPLVACVRQGGGEVEALRSGELRYSAHDANIAKVVYVAVRDKTDHLFGLRSDIEAAARVKGFIITDNPSKAGYVVQVTTLAAGVTSPDNLRDLVNAGYGAPSDFFGGGATALLADILLAQRRVPVSGRKKLKSISSRSAVASSQMRLGLLVRREFRMDAGVPQGFKDALVRELDATISGTNRDPAK